MGRRLLRPLVLACALVAISSASLSCTSPSPTMGFELEGRVTDGFTGDGLSGAEVTFTSDTGFSASARTGGGGRYRMSVESDVPFGQVRAEREGYRPAETTVFFDADSRVIDLSLRPL